MLAFVKLRITLSISIYISLCVTCFFSSLRRGVEPLQVSIIIMMIIIVTEYIVCVQGHDPLTFSFLSSFLFLIGWEIYGPNYLKC